MVRSNQQGFRFLWTVWIVYCSFFLFLQYIECSKKMGRAQDDQGNSKKYKGQQQQESASEEDETTASPPEMVGLKGLASAGITYSRSSQSVPKCIGQNLRLEKVIQVTRFCEEETGEELNETGGMGISLCFTACMFKFLGLIGEDLMFTSNIDTVVIDIFPPIAHSMVKKAVRSCAKQTVLPLSKADNCTSFGFVKGCILRNVNNICSGE